MQKTMITSLANAPDLSKESVLGVDTETKDPELKENGPGWGRGVGNIVGVSIATLAGDAYYFPMKHEVDTHQNLPYEETVAYLKNTLGSASIKVGANCIYDYGWLLDAGIKPQGPWYDIQFAEALLDGNAYSYSLENIASKRLGTGKSGQELYNWAAEKYKGPATSQSQGGNIHRCPPSLVSSYACDDALLALACLQDQDSELSNAGLEELFRLECDLIPILVKMRMRGMPVDKNKANDAHEQLELSERILREQLYALAGEKINIRSRKDLEKLYTKLGVPFLRTKKGNPTFQAEWLDQQEDAVSDLINQIRKVSRMSDTVIQKGMLDRLLSATLHPSLHPLRGEKSGTVTGRFSSSKPNGQNFPARDDVLAPLIRGIFVPEEGYTDWLKMDASQIEYRMFAHFSGNKDLIKAYQDPLCDFHELVGVMLGGKVKRKWVKCVNFAKLYGAGKSKIIKMLKALDSTIDAEAFIALYEKKFPLTLQMMKKCAEEAARTGEIRTLLNRRITFEKWVQKRSSEDSSKYYSEAVEKWGIMNIERADTYKGINYLFQGSAADYLKKGIVLAEKEGIFEEVGYPHITVHDELDFSYHDDLREGFVKLKEVMEHAIPLKVPMVMSTEKGPSWGETKAFNLV
jgi:DNA polymerase-1